MILNNSDSLRLIAFFGTMAIWELVSPRRRLKLPKVLRWTNNFLLITIDSFLIRLCFPILGVGLATFLSNKGWGLLNILDLPTWINFIISIIILDLVIYFQHVCFHKIPALWCVHKVHHADADFDVSTGVRFHPIEMLISMIIKLFFILLLGPPAIAVISFELILNVTAMFSHSNINIPSKIDSTLRCLIVTPDMHRVHHSIHHKEANSNFGFNLSWWDKLFGTYIAQPIDGHKNMSIGISDFISKREHWIDKILILPFMKNPHIKRKGKQKKL